MASEALLSDATGAVRDDTHKETSLDAPASADQHASSSVQTQKVKAAANGDVGQSEPLNPATGSSTQESSQPDSSNNDKNIIVIHVNDDARKMSKDFQCDRDTLLKNMKYFAKFLEGPSASDDVDISVHCDMTIFDWLVRFIHNRGPKAVLSEQIVASILISSHFLGIDALVDHCIKFIWANLEAIFETGIDLCGIDKFLIAKIAAFADMKLLGSRFNPESKFLELIALEKLRNFSENQANAISAAKSASETREALAQAQTVLQKCVRCNLIFAEAYRDVCECSCASVEVDTRGELVAKHSLEEQWAVHDEVRRMRLDKYSWQEVMWRLWASGFAVQCDFSPQRVMLSQLRAGVDKVYVRTLEGTFQEMQQQVDSIEESSATEATSSQQNNNDVKPGPRQLYGTHSNACSTHGHIFRVRDSSNAARRLDAWLSYQFARKIYGKTSEGQARFQHQEQEARARARQQLRRRHQDNSDRRRVGQNSTGQRSDDSSSDESSDDNGDTQGVGDAIGSDSDAETKAGDRKHTRSPSIQPQDFVVPHSTMEKQSGSLLRRVSVEFPDVPDSVEQTKERMRKWRKDFRYKNDSAVMVQLARHLLAMRTEELPRASSVSPPAAKRRLKFTKQHQRGGSVSLRRGRERAVSK